MDNFTQFIDKFLLAREASVKAKPGGGLAGLELELNLLDSEFHPLLTIGAGPDQQSFVDYLRADFISPRLRDFSQLEVFHWMIEWATQPYFQPRSAIYEARLLEGILVNALSRVGKEFDERLYMWPGNLPYPTSVSLDSIPGSWHIAKRRYLEKCIQLYGDSLATAGTHTNLSLPDALFEWDYMRLPKQDRTGGDNPPVYLDQFKSEFYITAARALRAFASLFIATSASTPFSAGTQDGQPVVYLSRYDSVRNLTFPNPGTLDLPDLYHSLESYLNISYNLARQGIRFGNNNWTPTRARSFAEPVERLIDLTSEQLHELYGRGLFVLGQDQPLDDMIGQIEVQNLLARINLPMARVEIRSDDGGNPLDLEIANITLKYLLLLRIYADKEFASLFAYDENDIQRARKNEESAAKSGLYAQIENPFHGQKESIREFLTWTLSQVETFAYSLDLEDELIPLQIMATGGPNHAERLRNEICEVLGDSTLEQCDAIPVPIELLKQLAENREREVQRDIESIAETYPSLEEDSLKLGEMLHYCREDVHLDPLPPIRFQPRPEAMLEFTYADKTSEIVDLAKKLIEIPSVTAGGVERREEVIRAATLIYDYFKNHGLQVRYFDHSQYPAVFAGFPGQLEAPVMFSGHFDVVAPEPDDSQFEPFLEGDYLWGRGSADMKTVVATFMVWMKDQFHAGKPYPGVNLLLVGNEENGESEPMGTPHVLEILKREGYYPDLFIAGERTGEAGNELWGEICTENRGVMRFEIAARGQKGHTGVASQSQDISELLLEARAEIAEILGNHLTLTGPGNWRSQFAFPYIEIGEPGVYNVRPDFGRFGVEIRPIPQDDLYQLAARLEAYSQKKQLDLKISVMENGIACDPDNHYLQKLIEAIRGESRSEPNIGKKLPGTSARFAPQGQGIVWGQSGLNPHARDERHFVPSILPYYRALTHFSEGLRPK